MAFRALPRIAKKAKKAKYGLIDEQRR